MNMDISAAGPIETESGEALAVPVFEDRAWGPGAEWAAEQVGPWLDEYLDEQGFEGKLGEVLAVPTMDRLAFRTLVLVGLGADVDAETLRQASGWLGRRAGKMTDVATTLHQVDLDGAAAAVVEGFLLGQYRFDEYKSSGEPPVTESLRLLAPGGDEAAAAAGDARALVDSVALARDLINEPALGKAPAVLSDKAIELGEAVGVRVEVLEADEIEQEGLGGLMGVAMGAHNPARLVRFLYEPEHPKGFMALVGKGIVFDSGGLSLKTAEGMETMKTDMSGAAAVFGAVQAIATLGIPVKVLGITPLAENMPGGGAMRPGDVIRPRNGKTVEVLNTDAEGRLVLADGLALASEAGPDLIVDLATLTGACKVALGEKIGGLWSNDDDAAGKVLAAAARAGERFWRMPLVDDYRKNLDSDIADIKNTGIRWGGAIHAALFLREFVGDVAWVHLDIAGPARWPSEEHYQSKGGSGFGVRTLVALAREIAEG
jgi:leucyl aminopeptidase